MATDFRSGKDFPRRGRQAMDGYLWLARVFDKARAAANGTIHDYIYPCPMDKGVFERWGISPAQFDAVVREHADDDGVVAWVRTHVNAKQRDAANRWLLDEKQASLDKQDAEEGAVAV